MKILLFQGNSEMVMSAEAYVINKNNKNVDVIASARIMKRKIQINCTLNPFV